MKSGIKILIGLAILLFIILAIGFSLPAERMVSKKAIYNKIYFFILADVSNHFNEASWRTDIDTVIQQEDIDGLRVWLEKYTNGDSLLLKTLKITEADLIRETIEKRGKNRLRIIQLKDVDGRRTAIKMTEEIIIRNPFKRLLYLVNDKSGDFCEQYLRDLKTKYENQGEDEDMFF